MGTLCEQTGVKSLPSDGKNGLRKQWHKRTAPCSGGKINRKLEAAPRGGRFSDEKCATFRNLWKYDHVL